MEKRSVRVSNYAIWGPAQEKCSFFLIKWVQVFQQKKKGVSSVKVRHTHKIKSVKVRHIKKGLGVACPLRLVEVCVSTKRWLEHPRLSKKKRKRSNTNGWQIYFLQYHMYGETNYQKKKKKCMEKLGKAINPLKSKDSKQLNLTTIVDLLIRVFRVLNIVFYRPF